MVEIVYLKPENITSADKVAFYDIGGDNYTAVMQRGRLVLNPYTPHCERLVSIVRELDSVDYQDEETSEGRSAFEALEEVWDKWGRSVHSVVFGAWNADAYKRRVKQENVIKFLDAYRELTQAEQAEALERIAAMNQQEAATK